ncbi:hypothetical protein FKW77_000934 [Venturia effusa]|uniref:Uncharacterized protein n=1 Tax=Venturia effusa TaxID=50376 RepID=A0A517LRE0_9PEZI|nr:hypothetical protein FKW77_000934 [Venturia effusa]
MGFARKDAINNSVGRKPVICKVDKALGSLRVFPVRLIDDYVKIWFIGACVSVVGNLYERTPISLEIALFTILRESVNFISAIGIHHQTQRRYPRLHRFHHGDGDQVGIRVKRLVTCFAAMSSRLVCVPAIGMPFVLGLRYAKMNLTKAKMGHPKPGSFRPRTTSRHPKPLAYSVRSPIYFIYTSRWWTRFGERKNGKKYSYPNAPMKNTTPPSTVGRASPLPDCLNRQDDHRRQKEKKRDEDKGNNIEVGEQGTNQNEPETPILVADGERGAALDGL